MPTPPDPARRGGDWRASLDALRDPGAERSAAEPGTGDGYRELGLQFAPRHLLRRSSEQWQGPRDEPALDAASVDRIAVRPVARGARGGWAKADLTWQNIAYKGEGAGVEPAQARWFAQFALLKGGSPGTYNPYGSAWITLDAYESPLLWALLAEAARLGIALAGTDAAPRVRLHGSARIVLDARLDAAALTLAPALELDGAPTPLAGTRAVGEHGVVRCDLDAGALDLAPLAAPLGAAERDLLERPPAISVPADDLPEFLRGHYPALARRVAITSGDDSFAALEIPPATLVLDVRYADDGGLKLAWRWEHADGRASGLDAPDADFADPAREREGEVLGAVDVVLSGSAAGRMALATGSSGIADARDRGGLEPAIILRGDDAASFDLEVLPGLASIAGLRVERRGDPAAVREVTEPPHLAVSLVESHKADWFDLGVIVTVGGRQVPLMPLFRALSLGRKRLRLPDRTYLRLDQPVLDELRELIDEAGTLAEWETGLRVPASRAGLVADFEDLAHEAAPAVAWRDLVRGLEGGEVEALAQPEGVVLPLRPYQLEGFRRLAFLWRHGIGGVLADDMGLGKTAQSLALVVHATSAGAGRPWLVVTPTSVASNWVAEAARFTPGLRVARVTETERRRGAALADAVAGADLVVTTYAVLRRDADAFAALDWAGVVLDEAQFVKNAATQAHRAALGLGAPFVLAVTGTPIENDLGELWAILRLVAPGLFPSRRAFDERYRRPIEQDGNAERRATLRRRIRPLVLRRTKEQVAPELPPKQDQVLRVALEPAHRRLYDQTLQRERQKLLGLLDDLDRQRFIVYRSLTLLRMLALDATLIDAERHAGMRSAKLDALFEQLADVLAEGHRALVFSQFTSFLDRVTARLDAEGVPFARLDGSSSARARDAAVERFRAGGASVFCISLKAGGFGLNLTEADYVFLLDPWWNPASEAQAVDRAHRIGQDRQVMVYRLVAEDTIEEKVMALKERKGELVASILADDEDAGAGAAEALTVDDLRGLLDD
ncbi:DNA helicase [Agromyces rhizosphaerae]|uniref:DNA helicase n=1 Tax=Agromyces rhizosphaerae TaxID=88374 RepID=A0A9W6CSP1_9MICO|nr:DEAD/DEAH box helicase [Agromyces rhizosphaerae]GLI27778.1 DNA helicase [Agromyces rhizosphaerae]